MSEPKFYPSYLVVSGQLKKKEKEFGIEFWDDRDPRYQGREGEPSSYLFRKSRPCKMKLAEKMKIQKRVNTFYLVDSDKRVAEAVVNFFHQTFADVTIQTYEPYRGKGYATVLFGWVSDWLTEHGFIHESNCSVDNTASIKMHKKLGFEIVGHIRWASKAK